MASIAVFALGGEGAFRAYKYAQRRVAQRRLPPLEARVMIPSEDPTLLFEFNPGWRNETFTVNSHGMPDREVTLAKPDGEFRIAFVGDSISGSFGFVPRNEIYLRVIESMLNQRFRDRPRFQSLNFGVSGYSISQSLRTAEVRAMNFDPDLIIGQLALNDPYPGDSEYERFAPVHPVRLWSFFFRLLRPARFWGYYFVDRNYDERGLKSLRDGFRGFAKLSRGGPPVLLVLFPYLYSPAYDEWGYPEVHDHYRRAADASAVPFLDLYATFRKAGLIDDRWPKDPLHPDTRGHEVAAKRIFQELAAREWIPKGS